MADEGGPSVVCGDLGGDPAFEGGCAWIQTESDRLEVRYPGGWRVDFEPIVHLLGPAGEDYAAGDRVCVRGNLVDGAVSTCMVGRVFLAELVIPRDEP
jgi:hypothetical protein